METPVNPHCCPDPRPPTGFSVAPAYSRAHLSLVLVVPSLVLPGRVSLPPRGASPASVCHSPCTSVPGLHTRDNRGRAAIQPLRRAGLGGLEEGGAGNADRRGAGLAGPLSLGVPRADGLKS